MDELKERILRDGQVLEGNILKVDAFLNHQVDSGLMKRVGEEFAAQTRTMFDWTFQFVAVSGATIWGPRRRASWATTSTEKYMEMNGTSSLSIRAICDMSWTRSLRSRVVCSVSDIRSYSGLIQ